VTPGGGGVAARAALAASLWHLRAAARGRMDAGRAG
jgi:hypothetical protein